MKSSQKRVLSLFLVGFLVSLSPLNAAAQTQNKPSIKKELNREQLLKDTVIDALIATLCYGFLSYYNTPDLIRRTAPTLLGMRVYDSIASNPVLRRFLARDFEGNSPTYRTIVSLATTFGLRTAYEAACKYRLRKTEEQIKNIYNSLNDDIYFMQLIELNSLSNCAITQSEISSYTSKLIQLATLLKNITPATTLNLPEIHKALYTWSVRITILSSYAQAFEARFNSLLYKLEEKATESERTQGIESYCYESHYPFLKAYLHLLAHKEYLRILLNRLREKNKYIYLSKLSFFEAESAKDMLYTEVDHLIELDLKTIDTYIQFIKKHPRFQNSKSNLKEDLSELYLFGLDLDNNESINAPDRLAIKLKLTELVRKDL